MTVQQIESKIYLYIPDTTGGASIGNTSFEVSGTPTTTFANWSESGGSGNVFDAGADNHSGSHAALLIHDAMGGEAEINGSLTGPETHTYRLKFWTHGNGTVCGRYAVWDSTHSTWLIPKTNTGIFGIYYMEITNVFTIPAGATGVHIYFLAPSDDGDAYFDDVSLEDLDAHVWIENEDVLQNPPPTWDGGFPGPGPLDLLANTGILTLALDNSAANSQGLAGLYSPDSVNCLYGFDDGMKIKVETTAYVDGATNLLLNPEFEIAGALPPTFASWTNSAGTAVDDTAIFHGGAHAAKLEWVTAAVAIRQSITVTPLDKMRLEFWTRGDGAIDGKWYVSDVTHGAYITAGKQQTGVKGTNWTLITYDYTVPVGCTEVRTQLESPGAAGIAWYDTVSQLHIAAGKTAFIGWITAIRPSSGLYTNPVVNVEAHDWAGFLSTQKVGLLSVDTDKRVDECLVTALTNFDIQPEDTTFDTGIETFPLVFINDNPTSTMANLFARLARNELGHIYVRGDGTLVFDNRDHRPMITFTSFTLDGTMSEFDVSYERDDIFNVIEVTFTPARIDTSAQDIWDLQGCPGIEAGQTIDITCAYRDAATKRGISAFDIVDPVTGFEFGSAPDFVSDDRHAYLTQSMDAGANATICHLTNTYGSKCYLNDWVILGKGIYLDDPITVIERDEASILLRGERILKLELDLITEPNTASDYATYLLGQLANPYPRTRRITFLANQDTATAIAAVDADISQRFICKEGATAIDREFYINRLKYTQKGPELWVEIVAESSYKAGTLILDVGHLDSEVDGRLGNSAHPLI